MVASSYKKIITLHIISFYIIKYLGSPVTSTLIYSNSGDNGTGSEDDSDNEDGLDSANRNVPG